MPDLFLRGSATSLFAVKLGAEGKPPKVLNVPKFVTAGEGRSHLSGSHKGLIYILLIAELRTCYVGKTISKEGKSRLKTHAKGHHPPTEELNRLAAENGTAVITMRFAVNCSEHDLNWWEAYYCDKYRTNGWTLLNRIQLSNHLPEIRSNSSSENSFRQAVIASL